MYQATWVFIIPLDGPVYVEKWNTLLLKIQGHELELSWVPHLKAQTSFAHIISTSDTHIHTHARSHTHTHAQLYVCLYPSLSLSLSLSHITSCTHILCRICITVRFHIYMMRCHIYECTWLPDIYTYTHTHTHIRTYIHTHTLIRINVYAATALVVQMSPCKRPNPCCIK